MSKRSKIFTAEEILQVLVASDSKLSDVSDDDDIEDITFEPYILEGEYCSGEHDIELNLPVKISTQKTSLNKDSLLTSTFSETLPQSDISKALANLIRDF